MTDANHEFPVTDRTHEFENMSEEQKEIKYLGEMLTATSPEDESRLHNIMQRLKEITGDDDQAQLRDAIHDLLCELRIDTEALYDMAAGESPDSPRRKVRIRKNPHCKVQLSYVVAQKLLDAGVIEKR